MDTLSIDHNPTATPASHVADLESYAAALLDELERGHAFQYAVSTASHLKQSRGSHRWHRIHNRFRCCQFYTEPAAGMPGPLVVSSVGASALACLETNLEMNLLVHDIVGKLELARHQVALLKHLPLPSELAPRLAKVEQKLDQALAGMDKQLVAEYTAPTITLLQEALRDSDETAQAEREALRQTISSFIERHAYLASDEAGWFTRPSMKTPTVYDFLDLAKDALEKGSAPVDRVYTPDEQAFGRQMGWVDVKNKRTAIAITHLNQAILCALLAYKLTSTKMSKFAVGATIDGRFTFVAGCTDALALGENKPERRQGEPYRANVLHERTVALLAERGESFARERAHITEQMERALAILDQALALKQALEPKKAQ